MNLDSTLKTGKVTQPYNDNVKAYQGEIGHMATIRPHSPLWYDSDLTNHPAKRIMCEEAHHGKKAAIKHGVQATGPEAKRRARVW